MAISVFDSGTETPTVGVDTQLGATITAAGLYRMELDAVNMVAGDGLDWWVEESILAAGTLRMIGPGPDHCSGAQPEGERIKRSRVATCDGVNSVEFHINQTFGTARAFPWRIIQLA